MKKEKPEYPILPLGEDWRIRRFDPFNIVLEERKVIHPKKATFEGETREGWKIEGYYGDLPAALDGAVRKRLEPAPLTVLMRQVEGLRAEIAKAVAALSPQKHVLGL